MYQIAKIQTDETNLYQLGAGFLGHLSSLCIPARACNIKL